MESHRLCLQAKELGIITVDASAIAITFTFGQNMMVEPVHIIDLMQKNKGWRMVGADKLRVEMKGDDVVQRIENVRRILNLLKN